MKRRFFAGMFMYLFLAAGLAGLSAQTASEAFAKDQTEMPAPYKAVINTYSKAVAENWRADEEDDRLNKHHIPSIIRLMEKGESIVAALLDIDGDKTPELIIYGSAEFTIWNVYTIKNGKAVCLFTAGERDHWYLKNEGNGKYLLENDFANDANSSGDLFYSVKNGALVYAYGVVYEMFQDGGPWFEAKTKPDFESEDYLKKLKPIKEEKALKLTEGSADRRLYPKGKKIATIK